jgi:ligand-binding SRPBCC domain-containing protein
MRASRPAVFAFHADAGNLSRVLPTMLPLRAVGPSRLDRDARVRFQFGPLGGFGVVRVWEPPLRFVDEQTFGPFALWRHEHRFNVIDGVTWVTDIVDFALRPPARPLEPLLRPLVRLALLEKLRRTRTLLEHDARAAG